MNPIFIRFLSLTSTIFLGIVVVFAAFSELGYIPNNNTNMLQLVGLAAVFWFLVWQLKRSNKA